MIKPNVTILNNKLTITDFDGEIDLADYQSDKPAIVRIYNNNGSLDLLGTWLLCEVLLPAISYETTGEGEESQSVKSDMDDSDIIVTLWDMEE